MTETLLPDKPSFVAMVSRKKRESVARNDDAALWALHEAHPLTQEQLSRLQELAERMHSFRNDYETQVYSGAIKRDVQLQESFKQKWFSHYLLTEEYKDLAPIITQVHDGQSAFLSPDGLQALQLSYRHNHYAGETGDNLKQNDLFPELVVAVVAKRAERAPDAPTLRAQANVTNRNLFYSRDDEGMATYAQKFYLNDKPNPYASPLDSEATYVGNNAWSALSQETVTLYRALKGQSDASDVALRLTYNAIKHGTAMFRDISDKDQSCAQDVWADYHLTGKAIATHVSAIYEAALADVRTALEQISAAPLPDDEKNALRAQLYKGGEKFDSYQHKHDLAVVPEHTLNATASLLGALHASSAKSQESPDEFERDIKGRMQRSTDSFANRSHVLEVLGHTQSNELGAYVIQ